MPPVTPDCGYSSDASLVGSCAAVLGAIEQSMMVIELDMAGRVVTMNANFSGHIGAAAQALVGQTFSDLLVDPSSINPSHPDTLRALAAGQKWWGVLQCHCGDGSSWLDVTCCPVRDDVGGEVVRIVALAVDVTTAVSEPVVHPAPDRTSLYDSLTGLANRGLVYAQLDQAIGDSVGRGSALAVVLIDLVKFRQVNDSLGQAAGDALLCEIGQRLTRSVRSGDIVGRLAGDQFMVVLPQCDAKGVEVVSKNLSEELERPFSVGEALLKPSVSVGISLYPDNGRDMDTLVRHAEFALEQAKDGGRHRIHFFSPILNELANDKRALEVALQDALDNNALRLHFQPQVRLIGSTLHGVEALARWHHPERGDIAPGVFVPIAEDADMIQQLGEWALKDACQQLARWRADGLTVPSISVNLSPTNFQHVNLPDQIERILSANGLLPDDLTLEMTESVLLGKQAETMRTLSALFDLGVRLSMDDFGTGYSSLGHLRRLPVSELKLDRSFVMGLEHDTASRTLSSAIIRIADSLGLSVVAEGVETAAQRDFLIGEGCLAAQGYFYAKPMSAEHFAMWRR